MSVYGGRLGKYETPYEWETSPKGWWWPQIREKTKERSFNRCFFNALQMYCWLGLAAMASMASPIDAASLQSASSPYSPSLSAKFRNRRQRRKDGERSIRGRDRPGDASLILGQDHATTRFPCSHTRSRMSTWWLSEMRPALLHLRPHGLIVNCWQSSRTKKAVSCVPWNTAYGRDYC